MSETPTTAAAQSAALDHDRRPSLRLDVGRVARAQAAYYLLTGVWPLLSRRTFEAVTGRKHDFWLVQTVGALVGVIGAALAAAARDDRSLRSPAIRTLAVGSAVSLGAVDLVFVARRRISPIYLADTAAELALVVGWLRTGRAPARSFVPPPRG